MAFVSPLATLDAPISFHKRGAGEMRESRLCPHWKSVNLGANRTGMLTFLAMGAALVLKRLVSENEVAQPSAARGTLAA